MARGKIGIDGRVITSGGISTYVSNLIKNIPTLDPLTTLFPRNNLLWNMFRVPVSALNRRWKLFHAPAYTSPLLCPCPIVLTVHDISYLVKAEWYPYRLDKMRNMFYRASMNRAEKIIVPSNFSKSEIVRVIPSLESRLHCVPMAVSEDFYPDDEMADRVVQKYNLPERFVLHVGDIHPRRNIGLLDRVTREVDLPLVLIGKILVPAKIRNSTINVHSIRIEELRGFYSAATVLAYPSVYEGFGIPLLEAMACGLPIVAAERASIPEVCNDAAVLVEPEFDALCSGINKAISNRDSLIEKGLTRCQSFSWQETARKTCEVYEELGARS